ncbi:MAG TPA: hypothetical protein VMV77_12895 [Bacteroidales bacterium]|nr:hypothetical protein [Bacteroidales bacterium]
MNTIQLLIHFYRSMKKKKATKKKESPLRYDEIILKIPLYHGDFGIVATNDIEELERSRGIVASEHGIDELYGHAFLTENDKTQLFLIVINPYHEIHLTNGVIAHESAHVADMIFQNRDIYMDFNNDEPYCYLIEGLVNEVYKFLAELKVKLHLER